MGIEDQTLAGAMIELDPTGVAKGLQAAVSKKRWRNIMDLVQGSIEDDVSESFAFFCQLSILSFLDDLLTRGEISSAELVTSETSLPSIPHPTAEEKQAAKNARKMELSDWFSRLEK